MKCPICGLINPDSAKRCDCGFDFYSRKMEKPYYIEKTQKSGKEYFTSIVKILSIPCAIASIAVIFDFFLPGINSIMYIVNNKIVESSNFKPVTIRDREKNKYFLELSNKNEKLRKKTKKNNFDKINIGDQIEVDFSPIYNHWKKLKLFVFKGNRLLFYH